jgi:hypothetical protein
VTVVRLDLASPWRSPAPGRRPGRSGAAVRRWLIPLAAQSPGQPGRGGDRSPAGLRLDRLAIRGADIRVPIIVTGVVLLQGGPRGTSGQHPIKDAALAVTGTTTAGSRLRSYFSAGSHGRFALKLAPGVYTVTAIISGAATMLGQSHKSMTVRSGQAVHVRIRLPGP